MTYSKKRKSIRQKLALALSVAMTVTGLSTGGVTVRAEGGTIAAGTYALGGKTEEEVGAIEGLTLDGTAFNFGNSHGIQTKAADTTIGLNLEKNANIEVTTCRYGAGTGGTMTSSAGEVTTANIDESGAEAPVFTVTGASGTTTLTFGGNMYIHSIKVEYVTAPEDVKTIAAGTYALGGKTEEEVGAIEGLTLDNAAFNFGNGHGIQTKAADTTIGLNLEKNANIEVTACRYGAGTGGTMTSSAGEVTTANIDESGAEAPVFTVTGASGTATLTFGGNMYIHSIKVEYVTAPEDVKTIAAGTHALGSKTEEAVGAIEGLTLDNAAFNFGNSHGIQTKAADTTIGLNLEKNANIEVTTCRYGAGTGGTMTSSTGEVTTANIDESGAEAPVFTVTGASGTTTLTFGGNMYIHSIKVEYVTVPDRPVILDPDKADVWDFGAEEVAGAYNNLTIEVINGFYSNPAAEGAANTGNTVGAFSAKDGNEIDAVKFVTPGSNHRLRTTTKGITCYDSKSKAGDDGKTYNGYLYSNAGSTQDTRLEIYLYEGDTLTCMLGSNGNAATYILCGPSGAEYDTFEYTAAKGVETAVFHAAVEGWYQLYCSNEKLVCARITRVHAPEVTVSGTVTAPANIPAGYGLIFTNVTTGKETEAAVAGGAYSCTLYGGYTYRVSLKNANGFIVSQNASVELDREDKTLNPVVEAVTQKTISGNVTGLSPEALAKVEFVFKVPADKVFVPEMTVNGTSGAYTLVVEAGVEYAVEALYVNDFALNTTTILAQEDKTADIAFARKPVYPVTLDITGVEDASRAVATFTNIKEEGYVYTFPVSGAMELRDGSYAVKVAGLGNYAVVQGVTPNVNVNGAAASTTVPFKSFSSWDFKAMSAATDVETIDGINYYAGLVLSASVKEHNNSYLLASAGNTITVPNLQKGDKVTIKYCYEAAFTAGETTIDEKSGSTGKIDSTVVSVAQDGDLVIEVITGTAAKQAYFCGIEVLKASDVAEYRDTLYVGADKEYKNINDALADVRKMARTADQKVTLLIDPGNYEEMLVVDIPDVTLKNASATPSVALKNKGVDIDDNAVRVTWYYGHGYTYYSMGSDCKYDAALLAANKSNGFASYKNPGSGTTDGSYWNATVVVTADNFSAEGIIFENSFNQYVSAKSVEDVIEAQGNNAKEGSVPRATMKTVGDTKVQEKEYVERAAALAIGNNVKQVYFNNCKFVGRQDTLYGGTGVTAAFDKCSIYGGTDYIFGGMTAVFKKCDLVFNTNDQTSKGEKDDVGYITAGQQSAGVRGYLMYECTVTSTTPGVDTASIHTSKPGYLGRPWAAQTGEAVFYNTTIEAADGFWNTGSYQFGESLIRPAGWDKSLSDESPLSAEYGTVEESGVDNSSKRVKWAQVFDTPNLADGSPIAIETFLGSWNPFGADDEEDDLLVVPEEGSVISGVTTEGEVSFVGGSKEVVAGEVVIKADPVDPAPEIQAIVDQEIAQDANAMVIYLDIAAFVLENGKAIPVTLKSGKVWMSFRYPEGFGKENEIVVLHGTEKLAADHVIKEDEEFRIAAESFSPYTVIFKSAPRTEEDPGPEDPGPEDPGNEKDTGDADDDEDDVWQPAAPNRKPLTSPKTFDDGQYVPEISNVTDASDKWNETALPDGVIAQDTALTVLTPTQSGNFPYLYVVFGAALAAAICALGFFSYRRRED